MKLYLVKISPSCRTVWLYCLQNNIPIEIHDVDVFSGLCFVVVNSIYKYNKFYNVDNDNVFFVFFVFYFFGY